MKKPKMSDTIKLLSDGLDEAQKQVAAGSNPATQTNLIVGITKIK